MHDATKFIKCFKSKKKEEIDSILCFHLISIIQHSFLMSVLLKEIIWCIIYFFVIKIGRDVVFLSPDAMLYYVVIYMLQHRFNNTHVLFICTQITLEELHYDNSCSYVTTKPAMQKLRGTCPYLYQAIYGKGNRNIISMQEKKCKYFEELWNMSMTHNKTRLYVFAWRDDIMISDYGMQTMNEMQDQASIQELQAACSMHSMNFSWFQMT